MRSQVNYFIILKKSFVISTQSVNKPVILLLIMFISDEKCHDGYLFIYIPNDTIQMSTSVGSFFSCSSMSVVGGCSLLDRNTSALS